MVENKDVIQPEQRNPDKGFRDLLDRLTASARLALRDFLINPHAGQILQPGGTFIDTPRSPRVRLREANEELTQWFFKTFPVRKHGEIYENGIVSLEKYNKEEESTGVPSGPKPKHGDLIVGWKNEPTYDEEMARFSIERIYISNEALELLPTELLQFINNKRGALLPEYLRQENELRGNEEGYIPHQPEDYGNYSISDLMMDILKYSAQSREVLFDLANSSGNQRQE